MLRPWPSATRRDAEPQQRHRVVVVGGGFGGLNAVRALAHADVDVTVIDRTNHHLFQPLLYQVAAGILPPGLIAPALRSVIKKQRNAQALLGEVSDLDLDARVVHATAPDGRAMTLPYDTLVVAGGATHSYFGRDDFAEFAPGMKTVEDARKLRHAILLAFEMAELATDPQERAEWLTFVVIGAGPTGVELVGQVAELAHKVLPRDYRDVDTHEARIILLEGAPAVLPPVRREAAALHPRGAGEDGRRDQAGHPGRRHGRAQRHGEGQGRRGGHPDPDPDLGGRGAGLTAGQAAGREDRRGDRPGRPDRGEPGLHAARTPRGVRDRRHGVAEQAARGGPAGHAGGQVRRQGDQGEAGRGPRRSRPFQYFDKGSMATIGHRVAVADAFGMKFTGVIGYTMWGFIHVLYLIGWGNRLGTIYTWARALTFSNNRGHRIITFQQAHQRAEEIAPPRSDPSPAVAQRTG